MNNRINQPHSYSAMLGDQEITLESGKLAKLAGGAVTVQMGESVILVTATSSKEPREGIDFFPLSVDFEERMYAAGRIPGSFFRREGRPSESGILLSRLVDRGLRPLFPKGYRNDVQIIITALSHGDQAALDTMAAIGASAALSISGIPFQGPVANVRIGMDGEGSLIVNPNQEQIEASRLDLRVTGSADAILMVECASEEVDEETMVQALEMAHRSIQPIIELQNKMAAEIGKEAQQYKVFQTPEEIDQDVRGWLGDKMDRIIQETSTKEERNQRLDALKEELRAQFTDAASGELRYSGKELFGIYDSVKKETVRRRILELGERPDGRTPTEIRPLEAEVSLLPRTHGSGLFTRGETQVLSIATLGTQGEAQMLDDLGQVEEKRYMHHYNFPPYSHRRDVAAARPEAPRDRPRRAGGARAAPRCCPPQNEFPYTIRVWSRKRSPPTARPRWPPSVARTLALMDAGVPLTVAGRGHRDGADRRTGTATQILTDIQGLEDHLGDMDFKVAGHAQGHHRAADGHQDQGSVDGHDAPSAPAGARGAPEDSRRDGRGDQRDPRRAEPLRAAHRHYQDQPGEDRQADRAGRQDDSRHPGHDRCQDRHRGGRHRLHRQHRQAAAATGAPSWSRR